MAASFPKIAPPEQRHEHTTTIKEAPASAPMIPHRVHTMRGPNDGADT
jgi:hypothetical protein